MIKKDIKNKGISFKNFAHLFRIFETKEWSKTSVFETSEFDKFCLLLDGLEKDQQELILTLTEKFLWVRSTEYISYFVNAFDKFIDNFDFAQNTKIIICPLLKKNDFGNIKSSSSLYYEVRTHLNDLQKKYSKYKIELKDTPENICTDNLESHVICLIDDFVGTGDTVVSALKYFYDKNLKTSQIVVLSLVAMETGLDYLHRMGCNIYVSNIESKGITGSGTNEEKQKQIMREIESQYCIGKNFSFGFKQSEALVKMIRTPNNTFPVYWCNKGKEGTSKDAPFSR